MITGSNFGTKACLCWGLVKILPCLSSMKKQCGSCSTVHWLLHDSITSETYLIGIVGNILLPALYICIAFWTLQLFYVRSLEYSEIFSISITNIHFRWFKSREIGVLHFQSIVRLMFGIGSETGIFKDFRKSIPFNCLVNGMGDN